MKPIRVVLWALISLTLVSLSIDRASAQQAANDQSLRVYIGTFTNRESKGIYVASFDDHSGKLGEPRLAVEAQSPSFLALHPNKRLIYSVNEVNSIDGQRSGAVSAFAIDPQNGNLKLLNRRSSGGPGPTHLWIDPTGKNILVANYAGGSVAVLPVRDDGSLDAISSRDQRTGSGPDRARQEGPHAHSIYTDPQNRFALSCDLGLDRVFVYRFDPNQHQIQANDPPYASVKGGSGPRHLAFSRDGNFVYVLNEIACTVTVFAYDSSAGKLTSIQTMSTLPEDFTGNRSTAEIFVHPNGNFVYASNRGDANSITVFRIDRASGKLSTVDRTGTGGRTPRGFGIDPGGNWLLAANQDTDNVVVFRIDQQSGKLIPTGQIVNVPTPVCITFVP